MSFDEPVAQWSLVEEQVGLAFIASPRLPQPISSVSRPPGNPPVEGDLEVSQAPLGPSFPDQGALDFRPGLLRLQRSSLAMAD